MRYINDTKIMRIRNVKNMKNQAEEK